jgi:quercetin dioxygenase-like cupin family protein
MPKDNSTITVVLPNEGQAWLVGSRVTCKISSTETGNAYTVLEVLLAPGEGAGLHVHQREDESLFVASGECTVGDRDKTWAASTGSVVCFPKGVPHFFKNNGAKACSLIITAVPGGLDIYFEEVSAALAENRVGDIADLNKRYEIEFLKDG